MLALTRKAGERIVMRDRDGREIRLEVAWIRGDRVRLAIAAPREVDVDREEIRVAKDAAEAA